MIPGNQERGPAPSGPIGGPRAGTAAGLTVVTGASGHIGANLTRALVAQGRRLRAVIRDGDAALRGVPAEIVRADVRDADAIRGAIAGADTVFHLAARISIVGDE